MLFKVEIALTGNQMRPDSIFDDFLVKAEQISEVFTKTDRYIKAQALNPKDFRIVSIRELSDELVE